MTILYPTPRACSLGELQCFDALSLQTIPELRVACELWRARFSNVVRGHGTPIALKPVASMASQSYELDITRSAIWITASDPAGLFYGLQTLGQLIEQGWPELPIGRIADSPDFSRRGYMLDISRCKVPKMSELKYLVDFLASIKINELQLYTEHTFAYAEHEEVWKGSSPMTTAEVRELDAYCAERFIDLVPNQNSFGHLDRWLRHLRYQHLAECPNGYTTPWGERRRHGASLVPSRESLDLLKDLYDQLLPNFSSPWFNVGCDETWDLGQGKSKERCEESGTERVYLDFLLEVHKLVTARGRKMMFWGDIILHRPDMIPELPKDIVGLVWGYEADHPFEEQGAAFEDAGIPFYVCPGTSSWNSLVGRVDNALANLKSAAESGVRHGAKGYLITDWGDGGHHQYWPISLPGILAGAGLAWNSNSDIEKLDEALDEIAFRDTKRVTGRLVLGLGRLVGCFKSRHANQSVFNRFLFSVDAKHWMEGISGAEMDAACRRLDEIQESIGMAAPSNWGGGLVCEELNQTIELTRTGMAIAAQFVDDWEMKSSHKSIRELISKHQELWLARNREGGLDESCGRLEKRASLL